MSQTTNNQGIINSWSLIAFAQQHGKLQIAPCVNKETGEAFKSCVFTDADNTRIFVSFSSKLGELSPREIASQKDGLQVVQLASGNYKLCKVGENTWEDVDLGI